jgi:hypothetical protein
MSLTEIEYLASVGDGLGDQNRSGSGVEGRNPSTQSGTVMIIDQRCHFGTSLVRSQGARRCRGESGPLFK